MKTAFRIVISVAVIWVMAALASSCSTAGTPSGQVLLFKEYVRCQVQQKNEKLQIVRLVQLTDGEVRAFLILRPFSRLGAFRTYMKVRAEDPIWAVGPGQDYVYMPSSKTIKSYVLLVRLIGAKDVWHVHRVKAEDISGGSVNLPDIATMAMLNDVNDGSKLTTLVEEAVHTYNRLREAEE